MRKSLNNNTPTKNYWTKIYIHKDRANYVHINKDITKHPTYIHNEGTT